jgi:hypothetical protein
MDIRKVPVGIPNPAVFESHMIEKRKLRKKASVERQNQKRY